MTEQLQLWENSQVQDVKDRLTRLEANQENLAKAVETNRVESKHDRANIMQLIAAQARETERQLDSFGGKLQGVLNVLEQAKGAKALLTAIVTLAGIGLFSVAFQLWQLLNKH